MTKLLAGCCAAAMTTLLTAAPALADPPSGTVPKPTDVVGVGAAIDQFLFDQFGHDYNASVSASAPLLYSWDTTNPTTGVFGDPIVTKSGCPAIGRPAGSSAGIKALASAPQTSGNRCVDFARVSKTPAHPDLSYIDLAGEAITYATQSTTDAPGSLTTAQLAAIYKCQDTNWSQVGGQSAPIKAFLPAPGSGTRTFFLSAIGVATPGSCVRDGNGLLQENEGVNPELAGPDTIVAYSVGPYIAQAYYSAPCLNSGCSPNAQGVVCQPKGSQNLFGCAENGTMVLNKVNGLAPVTPWPLTPATVNPVVSKKFARAYLRPLFDAVKSAPGTIPASLAPVFGPTGWACTSAVAATDLKHYGFEVLPAGTTAGRCGSAH